MKEDKHGTGLNEGKCMLLQEQFNNIGKFRDFVHFVQFVNEKQENMIWDSSIEAHKFDFYCRRKLDPCSSCKVKELFESYQRSR